MPSASSLLLRAQDQFARITALGPSTALIGLLCTITHRWGSCATAGLCLSIRVSHVALLFFSGHRRPDSSRTFTEEKPQLESITSQHSWCTPRPFSTPDSCLSHFPGDRLASSKQASLLHSRQYGGEDDVVQAGGAWRWWGRQDCFDHTSKKKSPLNRANHN